jgi:DNA-directed RNA polymerase subunit H (RpoH/RPB5)
MLVKREHELVPVHKIMSASEIEEMLKAREISANNLPKILASDPQAKKLGAKPGDVLLVEREDGKEYDYYRQVVG